MEYKIKLKEILIFECKSLLGRIFYNKKPKLDKNNNYLNLGCGENIIDGYINADFFCVYNIWKRNMSKRMWRLDLRYPLNCGDEVFDGIYSEHTIEHLYPDQVKFLLNELYRILKKKSIIRITVPDIEKYINYYNKDYSNINSKEFDRRFKTRCSAIRNMTQNYFHTSAWDFQELKSYLEDAGFVDIKKMSCNNSGNKKLKIDIKERKWETLYVEAIK